eukprot:8342028-Lingulodinium_polyedra.AAC.1
MSQSGSDEDLAGLAASQQEDPVASDQEGGNPAPRSPEIWCSGCKKSNKSKDPVEKKKHPDTKVKRKWGKTSVRKVGSKTVLIRCGMWCRYCSNILQRRCNRGKFLRMKKNNVKQKVIMKAVKDE